MFSKHIVRVSLCLTLGETGSSSFSASPQVAHSPGQGSHFREVSYRYQGQRGVEIQERSLGSKGYGRLPGGGLMEQMNTQRISRILGGAEGEIGKASQP